jgi:hypothetical protein
VIAGQARVLAPASLVAPGIGGVARVGQRLSLLAGIWSGSEPFGYAYQWQRCRAACVSLSGRTASAYLLTTADLGARLRLLVTASNAAGSAQAASKLVGPVAPSATVVRAVLAGALSPRLPGARIGALLVHHGYAFALRAPDAGRLSLSWSTQGRHPLVVASRTWTLRSGASAHLLLGLTSKGRALLSRSQTLHLTARATFAEAGVSSIGSARTISLGR